MGTREGNKGRVKQREIEGEEGREEGNRTLLHATTDTARISQ